MTRESCGTRIGLRLHQAHAEVACADCRRGALVRELELERVPARLPAPLPIWPQNPVVPDPDLVTAERRRVLEDA
ncbi:MAG: hypothetical protein ACRDYU_03740 [Actinomycetes bacterium]